MIKKYLKENKLILLIAFFTIIVASLPLLQKNLVIGDDYEYHLARIQSISDSLKAGIFPVKVHTMLGASYGYGSGLFYPNLFLYVPAMLEIIGLNLIISYKIFIILMLIFMFTITYFSINHITDDKNSALIGTILIILSKVLILNLYHRFALGEFLGYIFIPPVIAGIYDLIYKDFKNPIYIFIGFFGLINTHLISTLICLVFCFVYCIIHIKIILKNWKSLLKLLFVALLVLISTCSFWLPMMEQYGIQKYKFMEPWTSIQNDEFRLIDAIGEGRYSLGFPIIMFIPILFIKLFDKEIGKKSKNFFVIAICIILLQTTNIFWNITKEFSNIIQFKWRLLGIETVLFSISIALLFKDVNKSIKIKYKYIIIAMFLLASYFTIDFIYYDSKIDDLLDISNFESSEVYNFEFAIGGGREYLPLETDYKTLILPNVAISSDNEELEVSKDNLNIEFYSKINTKYYDIPFIYYKGYVANLTKEDGNIINLEKGKNDSTGMVRVLVPENEQGRIHVWYNGTKIQKLSFLISIFSLIIICLIFIIYKTIIKNRANLEIKKNSTIKK